jgi:hypothetical protein
VLLAQDSLDEWLIDFGFTHHMVKHASLFSSLNVSTKNNIYVANDFGLDIIVHGDIPC